MHFSTGMNTFACLLASLSWLSCKNTNYNWIQLLNVNVVCQISHWLTRSTHKTNIDEDIDNVGYMYVFNFFSFFPCSFSLFLSLLPVGMSSMCAHQHEKLWWFSTVIFPMCVFLPVCNCRKLSPKTKPTIEVWARYHTLPLSLAIDKLEQCVVEKSKGIAVEQWTTNALKKTVNKL